MSRRFRGSMMAIQKGRSRGIHKVNLSRQRAVILARARPQIAHGWPRGAMRGEFKYIDSKNAAMVCDTTGAVLLLNGCSSGSGVSNRVGRQITIKAIQLHWRSWATAATGVKQDHRFMVVQDMQPNGVALTIAEVLAAVVGIDPCLDVRNLDYRLRFKVLYDRKFSISAQGLSGAHRTYKLYKKVNIQEQFNVGDAGTVADISTNSLYFITMGSEAAGNTAGAAMVNARVRFTDA